MPAARVIEGPGPTTYPSNKWGPRQWICVLTIGPAGPDASYLLTALAILPMQMQSGGGDPADDMMVD
jgi:hypothetical protein